MIRALVRVRPGACRQALGGPEGAEVEPAGAGGSATAPPPLRVDGQTEVEVVRSRCKAQRFVFSRCFGPSTDNSCFYARSGIQNLVEHAIKGYAATVFSYGQTGSGKTHTVFGADGASGCFGRAMQTLYQARLLPQYRGTNVKVTSIEIYNDRVTDLLQGEESRGSNLGLAWSARENGFIVKGATYVECEDLPEALRVLKLTMRTRRVGSHRLNAKSNRSHCVVFVYLTNQEEGTFGKLTFCDLAGSERLKQTVSADARESGHINKSLFTLSKVIRSIEAKTKPPFRDSALTKVLCSSLGGSSMAMMIACVSELPEDQHESLRTLQFASRTMRIRNFPVIYRSKHEQLVLELRAKIRLLELENAQLQEDLRVARERGVDTADKSSEGSGEGTEDLAVEEDGESVERDDLESATFDELIAQGMRSEAARHSMPAMSKPSSREEARPVKSGTLPRLVPTASPHYIPGGRYTALRDGEDESEHEREHEHEHEHERQGERRKPSPPARPPEPERDERKQGRMRGVERGDSDEGSHPLPDTRPPAPTRTAAEAAAATTTKTAATTSRRRPSRPPRVPAAGSRKGGKGRPVKRRLRRPKPTKFQAMIYREEREQRHIKNVVTQWIAHHRNRNSPEAFIF